MYIPENCSVLVKIPIFPRFLKVTLSMAVSFLFQGFLKAHAGSHLSDSCVALRDVEAALRWLQLNIASFGGDPGRVTLVGHDTGAALVNALLTADFAKGLNSDNIF